MTRLTRLADEADPGSGWTPVAAGGLCSGPSLRLVQALVVGHLHTTEDAPCAGVLGVAVASFKIQ